VCVCVCVCGVCVHVCVCASHARMHANAHTHTPCSIFSPLYRSLSIAFCRSVSLSLTHSHTHTHTHEVHAMTCKHPQTVRKLMSAQYHLRFSPKIHGQPPQAGSQRRRKRNLFARHLRQRLVVEACCMVLCTRVGTQVHSDTQPHTESVGESVIAAHTETRIVNLSLMHSVNTQTCCEAESGTESTNKFPQNSNTSIFNLSFSI